MPYSSPRSKWYWRVLRWLGGSVLAILLLAMVLLTYLVQSESGSRLLWKTGVWAMQGKLTGNYVGGRLIDSLHLRNIAYRDVRTIATVDAIDGSWNISLFPVKLNVHFLHVGDVDLRLQSTSSAPPTPPAASTKLPMTLRLPLALELNDVRLNKLQLQQGTGVTELSALRLHGNSDGRHHSLTLEQLTTPYGDAHASLKMEGVQPFSLNGNAELSGAFQDEKFQIVVDLEGSLQQLGIKLTASGDKLNGNANIIATPFASIPLQRANIQLQHINPQVFSASAPKADLHIQTELAPIPTGSDETLRVGGNITIDNASPGTLDHQQLPLVSVKAKLQLDPHLQKLDALQIKLLEKASIEGNGELHIGEASPSSAASPSTHGALRLQVTNLDLHALHNKLTVSHLNGPVALDMTPTSRHATLSLADAKLNILVDGTLAKEQLTLRKVQLTANQSTAELHGTLATSGAMPYAFDGTLSHFNPMDFLSTVAPHSKNKNTKTTPASKATDADINMTFHTNGQLAPELLLKLQFAINNSSYDNLPMQGNGTLQVAGMHLLPSDVTLQIAGNTLVLKGSFGAATDRLAIHVDAPQLAHLGYGLSGLLHLNGELTGSLQRPGLKTDFHAEQLRFEEHNLRQLSGTTDIQANLSPGANPINNRLKLDLVANDYHGPNANLENLNIQLAGTFAKHTLSLQANGNVLQQPLQLNIAAQGAIVNHRKKGSDSDNYGWNGQLTTLENNGVPRITMTHPVPLYLFADDIRVGTTQIAIAGTNIDLKSLNYRQGAIQSEGAINAIHVAQLLTLAQHFSKAKLPVRSDLILDSSWNFSLANTASGFFTITRKSGDVIVNSGTAETALGLSDLNLRVDLQDSQAKLTGQAVASSIGTLSMQGALSLHKQNNILALTPDSAVNAHVSLNVPQLKNTGALFGPQLSLNGQLSIDLRANGTLDKPLLSGAINGDALAFTLYDQGIQLEKGTVRITMDQNVIDLQQIEFHGGNGTIRANGKVRLDESDPNLNALIVADHLEIFAKPDRQLMLSGNATIANISEQLHIKGNFTVDKALFDLPKSSAPQLGDDVVIVHSDGKMKSGAQASSQQSLEAATEKNAGHFSPIIDISVDMGNNFRFSVSGADLRLRGAMTVHSEPYQPLRASGTINVAEGVYEAFGTKLNIERGIINFQGPISNPNLNILAMRRTQDVSAGVEVTGNANQPHIRLVSEPNVSDEEKLSWIMFGQSTNNAAAGQRNASSQALAFLGNLGGKKIAKNIGLDQFSIGSSESGLTDEQVVNIGKQITNKISVGYEQSLTDAASIAKATWQLSRRWAVVARAGAINGLNILFTTRYD